MAVTETSWSDSESKSSPLQARAMMRAGVPPMSEMHAPNARLPTTAPRICMREVRVSVTVPMPVMELMATSSRQLGPLGTTSFVPDVASIVPTKYARAAMVVG